MTLNKYITVESVLALGPCKKYDRETITKLFGGRERMRMLMALKTTDVPIEDRGWLGSMMLPRAKQRAFARWCALEVSHLWDCPPIVRQYLETGDETIRDAAWAAAWDAAGAAAGAAARAAAGAAAWGAWAAASDAAWDAWATAGAAARDAAWAAAGAAAWDAASEAQLNKIIEMITEDTE